MKRLSTIAFIFFSASYALAAGSTYSIDTVLSMDDQIVDSPQFTLKSGEKPVTWKAYESGDERAAVLQIESVDELPVPQGEPSQVRVKFSFNKTDSAGKVSAHGEGTLVMLENEPAFISQNDADGAEIFSLKVVASKKAL